MSNHKEHGLLPADEAADEAAKTTLALNPLVGLHSKDLLASAQTLLTAMFKQPEVAVAQWVSLLGSFGGIIAGQSQRVAPPSDKRFGDVAWRSSRLHQALLQSYLAWADSVSTYVQKIDVDDHDRARAKLFADMIVDALSPTNGLVTNPAALKKFVDTGGESLWSGLKNYLDDLANNGGMPSQVDGRAFEVGKTLASTPGAVVLRDPMFELIQYASMTSPVWQRPIVITPPQINKYYSLDLSPERSLVRFLLSEGFQVFCISWRNPTAAHRQWGLEHYVEAVDKAVEAAKSITCSPDVSMMGACSGGITSCAYAAWSEARGERKVVNLTLAVCALDPASAEDTTLSALITPQTIEASRQASRTKGLLRGKDLAKVFAWMRPNDLIWNYWVSNYLMGNAPPAFDILYWNSDTTALPAKLHSDYLDLIEVNPFRNPGALKLSGTPIDLGKVKVDSYVVAGVTDHITPWKSVYQTARLVSEDSIFVLSNSGHLQSLVNPPGNPKSTYVTAKAEFADPQAFYASATKQSGSWWIDWSRWLSERSGEQVEASAQLGNANYPPREAAPGTYVFNA